MTVPSTVRPVTFTATEAVVRYQTPSVDRALAFYTEHLGFHVRFRAGGGFALVSRGDLNLILSGPETSGARPMPDGQRQAPGGWNRIVLYVDSIDSAVAALRDAGAHFRNDIEVGPGGKQIIVEDPDGNPIEVHEAPNSGSTGERMHANQCVAGAVIAVSTYAMSAGRLASLIAIVVGLIGVLMGGRALARNARGSARVALALGPIGLVIGALVVATAGGGLGTGHGLGGGVVAMVIGLIGTALGALALARRAR